MLPAKIPRTDSIVRISLEELEKGGLAITPANLVTAARAETHPLHSYFEWDDAAAGEKYRLLQAYRLISAQYTMRVVTEGEEREVHADGNHALRSYLPLRNGSDEYASRDAILADPEARKRNVDALLAELRVWLRRTSDLDELKAVRAVIATVVPAPIAPDLESA